MKEKIEFILLAVLTITAILLLQSSFRKISDNNLIKISEVTISTNRNELAKNTLDSVIVPNEDK